MQYRFLSDADFTELTKVFNLAFSDYFVPFNLTEQQLKTILTQRRVDLERSLGVFVNGEMVGFTINGFGLWNGKKTVYDAGTGVIPKFRRQKLAERMFDVLIPYFKNQGIEQYLLEVITINEKAFKLYEKLGFQTTRKVSLLKNANIFKSDLPMPKNVEIHEIKQCDWNLLQSFWDGKPTWQSSAEAFENKFANQMVFGAFSDKKCIGYLISTAKSVIAQIAVDKNYRRKAIGSMLLAQLQKHIGNEKRLSVVNLDVEMKETYSFFQNNGFNEVLSQFEMIKTL